MRAAMQRMIPKFRRGSVAFEALVMATTAATTAAVTYKIASKRIEAAYALRIEEELETTRKFYATFHEKPSIEKLVKDAGLPVIEDVELPEDPRPDLEITGKSQKTQYNKVVKQYAGNDDPNSETVVEIPEEVHNIFEATNMVPQDEVDSRDASKPYVITQDEFVESEYPADTLTYYAEDAVLADSQGMPFDNVDRLVGEANLQRFGAGSGDPRIVYVRNEAIDQDWEIVLHDGSYAEIVAGFTQEPESPRRRRSTQDE
jgi:hypothetical protein